MPAGQPESELAEPVGYFDARRLVDGEFEELEADVLGRRGRVEHDVRRRLLHHGAGLLFEKAQRPMAVGGGDGGRRRAKTVVEDFERQRPGIARFEHPRGEGGDVERALARETAVVAAPFEDVHREHGRVGDLHERDALAGDRRDFIDGIANRQRVEAVEHEAEARVIHRIDEPPRMLVRIDVPPPRKGFVADDHARLFRQAREDTELVGDQGVVADRVRRHVAARQHAVGAEFMHQVELAFRALDIAREAFGTHALEIAKRLEQVDLKAEVFGHAAHVGGRAVEIEQVVLEDLDAVESRCANRIQLLDERAADRYRRDGSAN